MTLEEYLRKSWNNGYVIDHVIRAHLENDDSISFYIHPHGKDGDTIDFVVTGNQLAPNPRVAKQEDT